MKKCSICGKEYNKRELNLFGEVRIIETPACDCEEKARIRYEEMLTEEKRLSKAQEETRKLKKALNCPLMTPLFESKSFENYEKMKTFQKLTSEYKENFFQCKKYARDFEKGTKGLFMVGEVGTGKTSLQACIIKELEKKGFICLLIKFSTLLDLFIESCSFDSQYSTFKLFQILTKFDYVVLDDIGREKYTDKRLELAFRIIDTLMDNLITLSVTTNPECFKKLIKIEEYKAIIDRLRYMCPERLLFNNNSFRGM